MDKADSVININVLSTCVARVLTCVITRDNNAIRSHVKVTHFVFHNKHTEKVKSDEKRPGKS